MYEQRPIDPHTNQENDEPSLQIRRKPLSMNLDLVLRLPPSSIDICYVT